METELTYISLFSGAGVGCYGFYQEGFTCVATCELLKKRLDIQRCNNVCKEDGGYVVGDLRSDDTKKKIFDEIEKMNIKNGKNDIDVLIATPPCQGISVANLKKKNELSRNSLVTESIKITLKIKPKIFIYENVRGFLKAVCTDIDGKNRDIKSVISRNLSDDYHINYNVLNFKDFGSYSSRTRTLVIGLRKDAKINSDCLLPERTKEVTLKDSIGDLESLTEFGKISDSDIYHNFRTYPKYMEKWIKQLKEGESAFSNTDTDSIPYKMVDSQKVQNKNKSGDKYKRWHWDRPGPCIHTRNDQLASQNTIHPRDNRVFSIRELMRLMNIPETFKWTPIDIKDLNNMDEKRKQDFLKKNEMNIRQCIGEGVPTIIFKQIAKNIKDNL